MLGLFSFSSPPGGFGDRGDQDPPGFHTPWFKRLTLVDCDYRGSHTRPNIQVRILVANCEVLRAKADPGSSGEV